MPTVSTIPAMPGKVNVVLVSEINPPKDEPAVQWVLVTTLPINTLEQVRRILAGMRDSRDIEIYRAGSAQHLVADVNREQAARYGIPVRDIEDAIETGFGGTLATSIASIDIPPTR